jgi:hypothetical protein
MGLCQEGPTPIVTQFSIDTIELIDAMRYTVFMSLHKDDIQKHCEHCGEDLNADLVCQNCCDHRDRDHGMCIECGDIQDPGEVIDDLEYRVADR